MRGRALAACLACGEGAFISSLTAAALWTFIEATDELHVTVPYPRDPSPNDVVVHRSIAVGFPHQSTFGAFPIATPARTLLDIAGASPARRLELSVDEALRRRRITADRLVSYLEREDVQRLPGIGELREIAIDRSRVGTPESVLETQAIRIFRDHGMPDPVLQYECTIGGRRVRFDLAYPNERVAIELDGRTPHLGLDQWQRDHDRHNAIEGSDWVVLRFTWRDITERPLYVVLTVAKALSIAPHRWRNVRAKRGRGNE